MQISSAVSGTFLACLIGGILAQAEAVQLSFFDQVKVFSLVSFSCMSFPDNNVIIVRLKAHAEPRVCHLFAQLVFPYAGAVNHACISGKVAHNRAQYDLIKGHGRQDHGSAEFAFQGDRIQLLFNLADFPFNGAAFKHRLVQRLQGNIAAVEGGVLLPFVCGIHQ